MDRLDCAVVLILWDFGVFSEVQIDCESIPFILIEVEPHEVVLGHAWVRLQPEEARLRHVIRCLQLVPILFLLEPKGVHVLDLMAVVRHDPVLARAQRVVGAAQEILSACFTGGVVDMAAADEGSRVQ